MKDPATDSVAVDTNTASPRLSVIALRVQASVRMRIGATMALKPSGTQSMLSLNVSTPLATYMITITMSANTLPRDSPTEASHWEKDWTKLVPLKNPLYISFLLCMR